MGLRRKIIFANKKDFEYLLNVNAELKKSIEKLNLSFNEYRVEIARKEQELKTQASFYKSRWLKIVCPNCNHEFQYHTMGEADGSRMA